MKTTEEISFSKSPAALPQEELHVWRVAIRDPGPDHFLCLGDKERERAERFKCRQARASFVLCRHALRKLLALYTGHPPESFALSCGQGIKPDFEKRTTDLHFNLSHSGDYGLLAFRRGGAVGIDLESVREIGDWPAIAKKVFSLSEIAGLSGSPSAEKAFFACWTRKEAVVKALGTGIGRDFSSFSVSVDPEESHPGLAWAGTSRNDIQLRSLAFGRYQAALASVGKPFPQRICFRDCSPDFLPEGSPPKWPPLDS